MESTSNLNATITDWLSRFATGRREALNWGAQRFAALVSPVSPMELGGAEDTAPTSVTFRVTSGMHAEALLTLTGNDYLVGSASDSDIVLRDPGVTEHHCRLSREWSGFQVRDLRTKAADVIPPAKIRYVGGGIDIHYQVGKVEFCLRQPPPQRPAHTVKRPKWEPKSALLVVLITAILAAIGILVATAPVSRRGSAADVAATKSHDRRLSATAAAHLLEQAHLALADASLQVKLHDGRLVIEGTTSKAHLRSRVSALTQDLHGMIDVEDHVAYVVSSDASGPGPLPVTVQSVMVGNPTYFRTDTGARYFVGGVLPDGAEVESISTGEIHFRRAGQMVVYKLQ